MIERFRKFRLFKLMSQYIDLNVRLNVLAMRAWLPL